MAGRQAGQECPEVLTLTPKETHPLVIAYAVILITGRYPLASAVRPESAAGRTQGGHWCRLTFCPAPGQILARLTALNTRSLAYV